MEYTGEIMMLVFFYRPRLLVLLGEFRCETSHNGRFLKIISLFYFGSVKYACSVMLTARGELHTAYA